MHQEKYTMTWHTYPDHFRNMMQSMTTSEEFTDVTIVSEDEKIIKAHKSVLSACSPVLKNILKTQQNDDTVIYLSGIQYSCIEFLLQFMYTGEIKLCEKRMNELLSVAKSLQIKELSESSNKIYSLIGNHPIENQKNQHIENLSVRSLKDVYSAKIVGWNNTNQELEPGEQILQKSEAQCKTFEDMFSGPTQIRSEHNVYQCNQCNFKTRNKKKLRRHIGSVHEGLKYHCNQCDFEVGFGYKQTLRNHIKSIHGGDQCDQCNFKIGNKKKLRIHIKSVHGSEALRNHIKSIHGGVKYECSQCNYKATNPSSLTFHIQSQHEKIRHTCNECNKQFSQKSHVKSHIESVHNGVKYSCSHCNQQYSQQSGLNIHIKSKHEGFRYACKYCEYQATDSRYLKNHIQLKHEGNRYACNMCDQQFSFKNALIKHMQSTHDICMKSSKYTFE